MPTPMALPVDSRYRSEAEIAVATVRGACAIIDGFYRAQSAAAYTKLDGSPVTDADLASDAFIREQLGVAFPDDGLLTEETEDSDDRLTRERCWIADPIDGTAQFVARTDAFDVLVALVEGDRPVVSISGHPPSGVLTLAVRGEGVWRIDPDETPRPFRIEPVPTPPRLVASQWYGAAEYLRVIRAVADALGAGEPPVLPVGFQPRAFLPEWRHYDGFIGFWKPNGDSPAREWDLAASDLFVTEAGGGFGSIYGENYVYNQPSPRPRAGLLVSASVELHRRLVETLAPHLPASPPEPGGRSFEQAANGTIVVAQ